MRVFLEKLASSIEGEAEVQVSWETKRRAIEALVEKITVRSHLDPTDSRGRRRIHTLCIKYNFEDPRPSAGSADGLVLEKEQVVGGTYLTLQRDSHANLVRAVLENAPDLTLGGVGAQLQPTRFLLERPANPGAGNLQICQCIRLCHYPRARCRRFASSRRWPGRFVAIAL